jgi:hypothetical protein
LFGILTIYVKSTLDITPLPSSSIGRSIAGISATRSNTFAPQRTTSPGPIEPSAQATRAQIEQVRLLVLGMEQRLQLREEKLLQSVQKAEEEATRFENMRKEISANS